MTHRDTLRALIVGETQSDEAADRILAWLEAGWMPRPEPGSAEWTTLVDQAGRAIYDAHWGKTIGRAPWATYVNRDVFLHDADVALRAALYPEPEPAQPLLSADKAAGEINRLTLERDTLRTALAHIAAGETHMIDGEAVSIPLIASEAQEIACAALYPEEQSNG